MLFILPNSLKKIMSKNTSLVWLFCGTLYLTMRGKQRTYFNRIITAEEYHPFNQKP